ncbi:transient receptor potential cation channel subfamily A member 1-like [Hyalella azteca]|uniref:Transient receptor potential cation channel subfamily A member 1-like n=1 Tax=Hyalella azteca TaxID=294128 RepID=A0A8B7NJW8_HYAAZ|nr:transient receptor potential cation channel subfamily A member 1-like [Hyalella azteca]
MTYDNLTLGSYDFLAVETYDNMDPTMFDNALSSGNVSAVQAMIAGDDSLLQSWHYLGLPCLHLACHSGSLPLLQLLLAHGVKVNQFDRWGRLALHVVTADGWLDGARLLLEHGASVNAMLPNNDAIKGVLRESPLHFAIRTGEVAIALLLLGLTDASSGGSTNPAHESSGSPLILPGDPLGVLGQPLATPGNKISNGKLMNSLLSRIAHPNFSKPVSKSGSVDPAKSDHTPRSAKHTIMSAFKHPSSSSDGVGSGVSSGSGGVHQVMHQMDPLVNHADDSDSVGNVWRNVVAKPSNSVSSDKEEGRPLLSKEPHVPESDNFAVVCDNVSPTKPNLLLKDGMGRNVLHLAAVSKSTIILQAILSFTKECEILAHEVDSKNNTVYHSVFSGIKPHIHETDVISCLHLLEPLNVDINSTNARGETPLFMATRKRLPDSVLHLLSKGADPTIGSNQKWNVVHAACSADSPKCLQLLLDTHRLESCIFSETDDGHVPFYFATCSYSLECLKILLRNGDHLTNVDSKGKSRCSMLLENIPSANKFLVEIFDEKITGSEQRPLEAEFSLTFDYSLLLSQRGNVQCSVVSELTASESENILTHPLIESFLFLKWNRIKPFFFCNFVVYILFLVLHTFYIVRTFGRSATNWFDAIPVLNTFRCFYIIVFMLILIPDMIIMLVNVRKYIQQWETYAKIVTLSTSAFVVFTNSVEQPGDMRTMMVERHVAAVSIFFAWVEFMMLLGRFPVLGLYILMFTKVAKSIIKFLLAFSSLLIGFALAFGIIFTNDDAFQNFPVSLVKTLMMMIGEIEYSGIIEASGMDMPVLGYIFLVAFLFLVPILMANLLIGLAVSDLPDLSRQGSIKHLSKLAAYLTAYELLMVLFKEMRCFPRVVREVFAGRCRIKKLVTFYPNKRTSSHRKFLKRWIESLPTGTLDVATSIVEKRRVSIVGGLLDHEDLEGHGTLTRDGILPHMNPLMPTAADPLLGSTVNDVTSARRNSPIPRNPSDLLTRSLSTVSRHTTTSHDVTTNQPVMQYLAAFEEQYQKDVQGLKQFIRSSLACALSNPANIRYYSETQNEVPSDNPKESEDRNQQPKTSKRSFLRIPRRDRPSTNTSDQFLLECKSCEDNSAGTNNIILELSQKIGNLESKLSAQTELLQKLLESKNIL